MHPKDTISPLCAGPACTNAVIAPRKYCSRSCYHQSWVGRKKRNRTGQMFACEACGSSFYRYQADITKAATNGSQIRYCSKRCENGTKSATNIDRVCPYCEETFTVWASRVAQAKKGGREIYCSEKCRDTANGENRRNRIVVACTTCGKAMERIPARVLPHMFCSPQCRSDGVAKWSRGTSGYGNYGARADLDGEFFRSTWEANIARLLRLLGIPYEFESRTFRLSDGKAYRPDFHVAGRLWVEVKGRMTEAAAGKISAFRSAYPNETLIVIGEHEYWMIEDAFAPLIPEWEIPWTRSKARRSVH